MSHKIAHLSLDFAGEESVSGGERRRRRWTRTASKSRGRHGHPPLHNLSVFRILLRSPASAARPPRGFGGDGAMCRHNRREESEMAKSKRAYNVKAASATKSRPKAADA